MATVVKDLGGVTAYADAVAAGYTGTREEFQELMASYASVAQQAAQSASDAESAKNAAVSAKNDAESAKVDAVSAKNSAVSAKNDAISAKNDAVSAKTAAETAEGHAEGYATSASGSATSAGTNALKSEGYAVGQQNGTDVGSGSPYYHNNAKYYAEKAAQTLADYKKFAYVDLLEYTFDNNVPVEITTALDRGTFNKYWQEVEYLPVIIDFYYNGDGYTVVAGTLNISAGDMYIIGEMENIDSSGLKSRITIRLFADPNTSIVKVYAVVTETPVSPLVEISYSDLVALRTAGKLVPGQQYRITDYATIINGSYNLSDLGSQGYIHYARAVDNDFFDVIVTADDASHLNENARACRRAESTYAPDAKPEAWEIKYCLDNDTSRFAWASSDGKGVIYYMKDEFGNEAGYDFKDIQFIRYGLSESQHHPAGISDSYELIHDENEGYYGRYGTPFHLFQALQAYASAGTYVNPFSIDDGGNPLTYYDYDFAVGPAILGAIQYAEVDGTYLSTFDAGWYYTFDFAGEDASVHENAGYYCRQNSIGACCDAALAFVADKFDTYGLPCNVWMCFFSTANIQDNKLEDDCFYNTFGANSWRNHMSKLSAMNCFGDGCYDLHLGNRCTGNIFERNCIYDVLGDECKYNIFHYSFFDSTLGAECQQNYFCSSTHRNSLGVDCKSNVFYCACMDNELSSNCNQNSVGYGSTGNKFFNSDEIYLTEAPASYGCDYCIFSNCTYIQINSSSIRLTFINVANSRLLSDSRNSTFSDCNNLYLGGAEYSTFRCLEHVTFGEQAEEYDGNVFTSNLQNMQYVGFEHGGISNVSTYGAVISVNIPDTIDLNTYIYEIRGATVTDTGKATIVTKVAFGNESGTSTTDGGQTWS